ncbi:gephyrin-like molybdotransferase Glp [uncultured Pseudacidovorax sp.]|uniref:molybdopterin molybdotransferase MoeA n=1 Tax=uncultured Pseudacidovorax sp. TaxID=679313 RepID=UPI0025F681B7|nr:gephyrin-like molybdotransferase Glp [uncultured Pseudacidovorax sp.]
MPDANANANPAGRRPLMPLDEALARLLAQAQPLAAIEDCNTFDADGRVLAKDLIAALTVPPADNSAMDGYAVRTADCAAPGAELRVAQRIPAGSTGEPLAAGTAARIFTGAPVPPGADAVVMQEDAEALPEDGSLGRVRVQAVPRAGQWIRRAGEDVQRGSVVLAAGQRLTPQALGLAASIGFATLPVRRRPRVAMLSTGDELVMPGTIVPEAMPPGAIYNSNRFFLRALLLRMGCEVQDLGLVPDRLEATIDGLRAAASQNDLIITTGGVSVGEEDHVKAAVQSLGTLEHWALAIKPGKPFACGTIARPAIEEGGRDLCHVCGLPGNPVSSFMTFLLLVRPFLMALLGARHTVPAAVQMMAGFDWPRPDRRREFLRARIGADGRLELFANQSSGVLTSTVWGDGVIDNPGGQAIAAGDPVRFIPFSAWLA